MRTPKKAKTLKTKPKQHKKKKNKVIKLHGEKSYSAARSAKHSREHKNDWTFNKLQPQTK